MPEKFREKYRKNQRTGSFQKSPGGARGGPRGGQAATWRGPTPGRARGRLGPLAHLWLPPFAYLSPVTGKPQKENPIPRTLLCSAAAVLTKIGSTRRPLPGTLPEGGLTSGSLLSTLDA